MEVNLDAGIEDWTVSASYYAKYFTVYALLSKIGATCEIHDCTINLFEYLFAGRISGDLIIELKESKEERIEAQYYTQELNVDVETMAGHTKEFILHIEEILSKLTSEDISSMRKRGLQNWQR